MKSIATWFAQNPVASNLLMMFLIVGGLVSLTRMKVELFPEFSLDVVNVQVIYPGASPEDVEESVCIPIEEEIQGLEGIKQIRSTSVEGSGTASCTSCPEYVPLRKISSAPLFRVSMLILKSRTSVALSAKGSIPVRMA